MTNYDKARLLRVDTGTGRIVESLPTGPRLRGVAVAGGSVWVANGGGSTLTRVRLK